MFLFIYINMSLRNQIDVLSLKDILLKDILMSF